MKNNASKTRLRRKPEVRKRSLSAADRQNILSLADKIGKIIPLNGYRSTFTLEKVAKARGLGRYLPKKTSNKHEAVSKLLEGLLVYKPLTVKKLVREILPQAIERRRNMGNPILLEEATCLAENLKALGIDMAKEISDLKLPKDRPVIVPPPFEIQQMIKGFGLHAALLPDCLKLFLDGHANESVRKALEKFEKTVQQVSGLTEIGPVLMGKAFDDKAPKIRLNCLSNQHEIDEQDGLKLMSMGVMRGWRNNLSHGDMPQLPPQEAFGRLVTVSNLFQRLDDRQP
jgi:uncharacterized protein (TIGR02391 family)